MGQSPCNPTPASKEEPCCCFGIERLYVKDSSFEAPSVPMVFKEEWQPKYDIDLQTQVHNIEDDLYEVVLQITVTAKQSEKPAYIVEVHQAGMFTLKNFSKEQVERMVSTYCPNILFPYARELCTSIVARGGFPPLYLAPVNFDALYDAHQKKNQEQAEQGKEQPAAEDAANE